MAVAQQRLQGIIAPAVQALGFELFGCELHSQTGKSVLRVYVEGPKGTSVTVDDCAKISRQVSAVLDVEDPIQGRYLLEVSSPGLERPLFTTDQYRRFIGQPIKLRLRVPREGQRNFRGTIKAVEGEKITLNVDRLEPKEEQTFSIKEIEKAKLIANF